MGDLEALRTCSTLRELTIAGNPVCELEAFSRSKAHELLPQVEILDDTRIEAMPTCLDAAIDSYEDSGELESTAPPCSLGLCHPIDDTSGLAATALAEAEDLLAEVEDAAASAALRDIARLDEENVSEGEAICRLRERWRQAHDEDGSTEA